MARSLHVLSLLAVVVSVTTQAFHEEDVVVPESSDELWDAPLDGPPAAELLSMTFSADSLSDNLHKHFTEHARKIRKDPKLSLEDTVFVVESTQEPKNLDGELTHVTQFYTGCPGERIKVSSGGTIKITYASGHVDVIGRAATNLDSNLHRKCFASSADTIKGLSGQRIKMLGHPHRRVLLQQGKAVLVWTVFADVLVPSEHIGGYGSSNLKWQQVKAYISDDTHQLLLAIPLRGAVASSEEAASEEVAKEHSHNAGARIDLAKGQMSAVFTSAEEDGSIDMSEERRQIIPFQVAGETKELWTWGKYRPRDLNVKRIKPAYVLLDTVIDFLKTECQWYGVNGQGMPLVGMFEYKQNKCSVNPDSELMLDQKASKTFCDMLQKMGMSMECNNLQDRAERQKNLQKYCDLIAPTSDHCDIGVTPDAKDPKICLFAGTEPFWNADWDGARSRVGKSRNSMRFGENLSTLVVGAHEVGHGVTYWSSELKYFLEAGALNEAYSDILGITARSWAANGKKMPDTAVPNPEYLKQEPGLRGWDIEMANLDGKLTTTMPGIEGIPTCDTVSNSCWNVKSALRRMSDPASTGRDHDDYCTMPRPKPGQKDKDLPDNGWVHGNSGVINLVFALLADGGKHPRPKSTSQIKCEVPRIGLAKAFKIAFTANTASFKGLHGSSEPRFGEARAAWAAAAQLLHGEGSAEWKAVHRAFDAVRIPRSEHIKFPQEICGVEGSTTALPSDAEGQLDLCFSPPHSTPEETLAQR